MVGVRRDSFAIAFVVIACASEDGALAPGSTSTTSSSTSSVTDASTSTETTSSSASSSSSSDGSGSSDSTGSSSSSGSTGVPIGWPPPPVIVLASEVGAQGGWLFAIVDAPLVTLDVALNGVSLGDPDGRLDVVQPVGVWRIPQDAALGDASVTVAWKDHPDAIAESPIEIVTPTFVDVAEPTGLAQTHDITDSPSECAQSHTGLAIGDYDDDGQGDLYVGNVGIGGRLFRNTGALAKDGLPAFEDATQDAGLAGIDAVAMATFVDRDGDGDLDLFIGRRGENRMLDNRRVPDGVAVFEDVTAAVGLDDYAQRTMGAAFGDYDGDEDLDLYVVNHAWCFPKLGTEILADDHLYRNDGGVFVERTHDLVPLAVADAPPAAGRSVGFSAVWVDLERDGDQDLIVINDDVGGEIGDPNEVWRNDGPDGGGGWQFTDVSEASGVAIEAVEGMGLAIGDVDADGFVDLAFSNIGANVLMLNVGDGTFVDVSAAAGIERALSPWGRPSVTWATHLWDHDNDGDIDLYFTGGSVSSPTPVPDALFENGGDGVFVDRTWQSGLADPARGKGSLLADLDKDGAWDLVTASWGGPLRVWRNQSAPANHHYVDIALRGRAGNRGALGAIVEITTAAGTQTCFHTQRPALAAGGDTACHFGLGIETAITQVTITWPEGTVQDVSPPEVDARVLFVHPDG